MYSESKWKQTANYNFVYRIEFYLFVFISVCFICVSVLPPRSISPSVTAAKHPFFWFGSLHPSSSALASVSGWGSSFLGVSGEDVVHDLVFIGTVVTWDLHVLPDGLINVSTEWVGVVHSSNLDSGNVSSDGCKSNNFWIHVVYWFNYNKYYYCNGAKLIYKFY